MLSVKDLHTSDHDNCDKLLLSKKLREDELRKLFPAKNAATEIPADTLVSIVVLNHNGIDVLPKCLMHIEKQVYNNFELIIADNNSNDDSRQFIQNYSAAFAVKKLYANENLGVAGGRNFAIGSCEGKVIAFLDNDGYADPLWLQEALYCLYSSENIGAVSSLVFFAKDPLRVNSFGGMMDKQGYAKDPDYGKLIANLSDRREILYPMGCGMLLKREVAQLIFPLDTCFLKWYDDTEIGIRTWNAGYRVTATPYAIVDHDAHSGDLKRESSGWKRALVFEKARIRNVFKYFPLYFVPQWFFKELLYNLRKLIKGKAASVFVVSLAVLWNILNLSSVRRLRKGISGTPPFWKLVESCNFDPDLHDKK